ncbi:hypothetical protein D3C78_832660 [compost metagenome]
MRFAFGAAQALHIDEGAVQEIARGRRDHRERVLPGQIRVACRRLVRSDVGRQRIEAGGLHALGEKLAFARRRGETAVRKGGVRHVQFLPADNLERLPVVLVGSHVLLLEGLRGDLVVAFLEAGIVEAHALRQQAEDFRIRLRFTERRDGRVVGQHVLVTVRQVDVGMLQLRRGWQQDVGVIGGVGLEMFQHHGEQVLAGKALSDFRRLGRHRHGVRVVHDQRFDLRAELGRGLTQQVIADGAHVDGARLAARAQIPTLQCTVIDREGVRRCQQDTARGLPPGANQGR